LVFKHAPYLHSTEKPIVIDMKPREGFAHQETEVWIKGRGFSEKGKQ
jgi:hypothetical protein